MSSNPILLPQHSISTPRQWPGQKSQSQNPLAQTRAQSSCSNVALIFIFLMKEDKARPRQSHSIHIRPFESLFRTYVGTSHQLYKHGYTESLQLRFNSLSVFIKHKLVGGPRCVQGTLPSSHSPIYPAATSLSTALDLTSMRAGISYNYLYPQCPAYKTPSKR